MVVDKVSCGVLDILDLLEFLDALVVLADVDVAEGFEGDGLLVQFDEHLGYLFKLLVLGLSTDLLLDAGDLSLQVLNMLQVELDHLFLVRTFNFLATLLDLHEAGTQSLVLLHELAVDLPVECILALVACVQNLLRLGILGLVAVDGALGGFEELLLVVDRHRVDHAGILLRVHHGEPISVEVT